MASRSSKLLILSGYLLFFIFQASLIYLYFNLDLPSFLCRFTEVVFMIIDFKKKLKKIINYIFL